MEQLILDLSYTTLCKASNSFMEMLRFTRKKLYQILVQLQITQALTLKIPRICPICFLALTHLILAKPVRNNQKQRIFLNMPVGLTWSQEWHVSIKNHEIKELMNFNPTKIKPLHLKMLSRKVEKDQKDNTNKAKKHWDWEKDHRLESRLSKIPRGVLDHQPPRNQTDYRAVDTENLTPKASLEQHYLISP